MNQHVATIEIATLTPATVFAPGGVEALVSRIEAEVSSEVFTIETAEGRERIKSVAYKVARSKTALDDMGKELVAGIKAQAATIDADRRTIRERLDALKETVRGPLTAWETAEANRIYEHEAALAFIVGSPRSLPPSPPTMLIRQRIAQVARYSTHDWQEFAERADAAMVDALAALNAMRVNAEQHERDAAELAELRRQKAARESADRIAAEAAQRAEAEKQKQAQAEEARRQHAAQIERERADAAAKAIANENRRIAEAHAAAEATRIKRENSAKHRAKIHREITDALHMAGFSEDSAATLIDLIAAGKIPRVSITY